MGCLFHPTVPFDPSEGERLGDGAADLQLRLCYQRVRHFAANSRHIAAPVRPSCFVLLHSSAQTRMRSRDARGSDGGGTEVSRGGSSGTACGAAGTALIGVCAGGDCGNCGRRGGSGV